MIRGRSEVTALLLTALTAIVSPWPGRTGQARDDEALCPSPGTAAVADSIAHAFDSHQFVFLGSTHGGNKRSDFLLCLLARSAFQQRVKHVLVEWANPVHQRLLDRYLLSLDQVPEDSLRQVWFDTDAPELWARLPQIPEFFVRVRSINAGLAPGSRIRVLGGSEPVNWPAVRSAEDIATYPFKTNWAAHVISEHFAIRPDRRLLVVYGDGHIHHDGGTLMSDVGAELDRRTLFVVGTITDLEADDSVSVGRLGDPTEPFFLASRDFPSSGPWPEDLFYVRDEPLASYVDAVAYLGPGRDRDLRNSIELTRAERAELARRRALKGDPRRLMELRFGRRDEWFRAHPNDIPRRP